MTQYWKNMDELKGMAADFSGQEFLSPPAEEKPDVAVDRREFLKLMGAGAALASMAACSRRPIEKIIPYVNQPEEIVPGVANWYASTCGGCPAACGTLVKTREGRPIKVEGNPEHPLSRGGLCARGQASILNLYDPDRLKNSVKIDRKNGKSEELSWDDVDAQVGAFLKEAKAKPARVRFLTGSLSGPSTKDLIGKFLKMFSDGQHVMFEAVGYEGVRKAQELCYGTKLVPHYRLEKADLLLSFSCDFLGTWLSPVEFARDFAARRKLHTENHLSRFVAFESFVSLTGTNADQRVPVKPGDETKIALALAAELGASTGFSVEGVAAETGIDPKLLRNLAKELSESKGRSLVLGGSDESLQVAVNLLNSLLGNDGVTVDAQAPSLQAQGDAASLDQLISEMQQGRVDLLLISGTNPAFSLPKQKKFAEALKKVPAVIAFSTQVDETAALADFVCAAHNDFETWGDANPQEGLYSLLQPTIAPLHPTRSLQESLLIWTAALSGKTADSWHDTIKNFWQEQIYNRYGVLAPFELFWQDTLRHGVFDGLAHRGLRNANAKSVPRSFRMSVLTDLPKSKTVLGEKEFALVLYSTISRFDGRNANNSWLCELPDPITKISWDNYLSIAPQTASTLNLSEGDVLEVKGAGQTLQGPVHLQPGLHPKVIAAAIGFGRTAAGSVGNGVGFSVTEFSGTHNIKVTLEKTGEQIPLASVSGHPSAEGRPIIQEATLADFLKNPHAGGEEGPATLPSMWEGHKYEGHRWGMGIDLNSCIGCQACVIGCQSENNIPTVGKEQILRGRELYWIQIHTYHSGDANNPEFVHQPMLCQHCENAPCETVCPTLATVHDKEGLNVQIYNRCVGTRYCSNNCPYKVRRFNWFEFSENMFGSGDHPKTPLNLVLNPDVTVREKGVMEKCTFCTQRIREGKDRAKDLGISVTDGEIKTACQQSCPAEAIVFGDLNDPNSKVAKLAANARGYSVLRELNTRPSITYLTKIRNR